MEVCFAIGVWCCWTRHFQIYLRTERITLRQLVSLLTAIVIHPHIEMARRWRQALMYCCKEESRISETHANIYEEITPPLVPKLVQCKRKLDTGCSIASLADDEVLFSSWVAHNHPLNLYKSMKIEPRMKKTICV